MPIYEYQCVNCGGRDQRVAGIDDATAICAHCGGLMLRLDEDIFEPYFLTAEAPVFEPYSPPAEAPAGCDGECRFNCEVYSPISAYCLEKGE